MPNFRKDQRVQGSLDNLKPNKTIYKKAKRVARKFPEWVRGPFLRLEPGSEMPQDYQGMILDLWEPAPSVSFKTMLYECRGYQTGVMSIYSYTGGTHGNSSTYSWTTDASGRLVDLPDVVDVPGDEVLHALKKAIKSYAQETGTVLYERWERDLSESWERSFGEWRPVSRETAVGEWEAGVEFYFDPIYHITPYSESDPRIFVPLILKQSVPPASRWYEVLLRWVELLTKLVVGLSALSELLRGWFGAVRSLKHSGASAQSA